MPIDMLDKSMLLGKLLALDLPLEHEGRIHQAIDHEQKTLLNHTHDNPGMDHWLRVIGSMARLSRQWACLWLSIYLCPPVLIWDKQLDQWL